MKTIIAGSRTIIGFEPVEEAIRLSGFEISEVVSGGCRGVDSSGESWARDNKVPIKRFPAKWGEFGQAAGPIRNREMAGYAEALIVVWDGKSRGTKSMIDEAKKNELRIYIHETPAPLEDKK